MRGFWRAKTQPSNEWKAAELVEEALAIATELGMAGLGKKCSALSALLNDGSSVAESPTRPDPGPRLEKAGQFWILAHADERVPLKDAKGLAYIAELMRHPDREIHALDLLALVGGDRVAGSISEDTSSACIALRARGSYADDVLEARARRTYQRRVAALSTDLEAAEAGGDPEQILTLREELATLRRELARATGLGGRSRASSDSERARISVTRTIRLALTRIAEAAPELGGELAGRIRTGTFCVYVREQRT